MTLWEAFGSINDFRRSRNRFYCLRSLLVVYTLAVLSGCGSLRGCAQFCYRHRVVLMRRFRWRSVPSFSTFSLLLRRVNAQEAEQAFGLWMRGQDLPAEPLCVDGKTLRGSESRHHSKRQRYTHTIQLFGQHSARVFASREDKDEAAALLSLLDDVEGSHTFTADACYTHKHVTQTLRARGHDYLLPVKANQPILLAALQTHMATQAPLAQATLTERNRGRKEQRVTESWPASFATAPGWEGIATVLRQRRTRDKTSETRYYIASLSPDTPLQRVAGMIRGHWHIENRLHWVKDTILNEDASRIRAGSAPYIAAILRNAAANLARNIHPGSVTHAIRHIAHDIQKLLNLPKLLNPL